jgi:hypothetical protein
MHIESKCIAYCVATQQICKLSKPAPHHSRTACLTGRGKRGQSGV